MADRGDGAGARGGAGRARAIGEAEWEAARLEATLEPVVERLGVKARDVYQPFRVAVTGTTVSPGIFETLAALGRARTLERVAAAEAVAAAA